MGLNGFKWVQMDSNWYKWFKYQGNWSKIDSTDQKDDQKFSQQIESKINIYKTWSSVSNSNLSKVFVPGSLESLKFRSSVISLQRSTSLKFILGRKRFGVSKKIWVWKYFGSEKYFGSKKICICKLCKNVQNIIRLRPNPRLKT